MKHFLLIVFFLVVALAKGQVFFGYHIEMAPGTSTKWISDYQSYGAMLQKPLSTTLNLQLGIIPFSHYEIKITKAVRGSDFGTFWSNNKLRPISDDSEYKVTYGSLPIGLEYKLTQWLRLNYNLRNNFYFASTFLDTYLEGGKSSVPKYTFSHNFAVVYHNRTGNLFLAASTMPDLIANRKYGYHFMNTIDARLHNTVIFSFGGATDLFPIKKRKKVL